MESISTNIDAGSSSSSQSSTSGHDSSANSIMLRWNDSETYLSNQIKKLWSKMEMSDVTLACEGRMIPAHKIILSLWSPYFEKLFQATSTFKENSHPVIIFRDTLATDLDLILQFMYQGQVRIRQTDAARFLDTAEFLQIAGLGEQIRLCTAAVISTPSTPIVPEKDMTAPIPVVAIRKSPPTRVLKSSKTCGKKPEVRTRSKAKEIQMKTVNASTSKAVMRLPDTTLSTAAGTGSATSHVPPATATATSVIDTGVTGDRNMVMTNSGQSTATVPTFTSSFVTSVPLVQTTYSTIVNDHSGTQHSNLCPMALSTEEMNLGQMHYHMEPIPLHEVQEAVAAANAESTSNMTPVMLLSIQQHESYGEMERSRNQNDNSIFETPSTISPYASYILPEMEHQYSSNQICDIGTISFSGSFEDAISHQHQHHTVNLEQPQMPGVEISQQFQPLQEKSNHKTQGEFVKIEKSGIINTSAKNEGSQTQVRYVPCGKCGKQVKEQSLKTHMKRTHLAEGVTFVECPICPKKLKSKGVFYKHMFNHRRRGEVPLAPEKPKAKARNNGRQPVKPKLSKTTTSKQPKVKGQNTGTTRTGGGSKVVPTNDASKVINQAGNTGPDPGPSSSTVIYQPVRENNLQGANTDITNPTSTHNQYQQQYQYEQL